ncbi:hypothetical protein [Kribbella sp. NPDC048928]|uniref:hypothetical protein n=1 Tax=Kribbella sp. NPDC048928 TaxID=3364111 RepID=UPI00370FA507
MTNLNSSYGNSPSGPQPPRSLFSLRTVVILLVALLAGLVVGALTFLAGQNVAAAVLAGLGASGVSLVGAHTLVQ